MEWNLSISEDIFCHTRRRGSITITLQAMSFRELKPGQWTHRFTLHAPPYHTLFR